ncbi:hypothetical protein BDQ12DRAFT_619151 [Crucibulum laeve]|uniref:Uncharacterized protein n=1 Tax=Crucibulum laeve TaxID=68775 RepID=A0A5C3LRC1_9AGAR|nr:hypothetical protein BDQ12DRAFT_619151 [Crucibulum laeve]
MGSDFYSTPTTSVDVKYAFFTGCYQVNFMQHNISFQIFNAQMAVGSWTKFPLFPGMKKITEYI